MATEVRERWVTFSRVFALLACICFVLCAFGVTGFGQVHTGWLGLSFLAAAFLA